MISNSNIRKRETSPDAMLPKKPKIHPMFAPKTIAPSPWNTTSKSLIHYTHLDPFSPTPSSISPTAENKVKVAFFDLDGTLIRTKSGATFPKGEADWVWWNDKVKSKLESLHQDGFLIAVISNQNGLKAPTTKNHKAWKLKIELITRHLSKTPFLVLAALEKDHFRKPMLGMLDCYCNLLVQKGFTLDLEHSFYVGDAAGRKKDHGDGDRKWAENAGLAFHTPETYFNNVPEELPPLVGFRPRDLEPVPFYTPTSPPLFPSISCSELIMLVGSPGSGKSTFWRTYLQSQGYERINQDGLGTRVKCERKVEEVLARAGKCVLDNTNRDKATRAVYIKIAQRYNISVRCFLFPPNAPLEKHNNLYRLYPSSVGSHVPEIALATFKKGFEEPTLDEGFEEVRQISLGRMVELEEEESKKWNGWMS